MPEANGAFARLAYTQAELQAVMRAHYDKIIDFIASAPFKALMEEMSGLSHLQRPEFVQRVLLDDDELAKRGVTAPPGILIQRSAFGDRRPTLFAVKHFLPDGYRDVWENVNITFDNEYVDAEVPRDRESCWREPLAPQAQAAAMANGRTLADI